MEKYLIIPAGKQLPYKQLKITWWWGIDAIEIANGNFIIGEKCFLGLKDFPTKIITVDAKEITLENALKIYPLVDESNIVFKTYEQIGEKEIIKTK